MNNFFRYLGENAAIISLGFAAASILAELVVLLVLRVRPNIFVKLEKAPHALSLFFALIAAVIGIYSDQNNKILENKVVNTEKLNLELRKEVATLEGSLREERNSLKSLTARVVVSLEGVWPPEARPFSNSLKIKELTESELLVLFPVQNAGILNVSFRPTRHPIFSIHELNKTTFSVELALIETSNIIGKPQSILSKFKEAVIFLPMIGWQTLGYMPLKIVSMNIQFVINGSKVTSIDRQFQQATYLKPEGLYGRYDFQIGKKDFK